MTVSCASQWPRARGQEDRAGGQGTAPPGRIEAVCAVHLAGAKPSCEPQVGRAREHLAGARPDAEGAERPGSAPLFPAVPGVRFRALARTGTSVEPANQQLGPVRRITGGARAGLLRR